MNLDFSDPATIVMGIVLAFIASKLIQERNTDKDGRIQDAAVKISNVLNSLNRFNVKLNPKLKAGYTEKHIQNQLKKHFLKDFVHVTDEYGIEGINATKIDFDIGHGKVGVELKLAKALFKTASLDRLVGQLDGYIKQKYKRKNIIVAVFGEETHTEERTHLKRIKERVESKGAKYAYFEISSNLKKS